MKIAAISDLHGYLPKMPSADVTVMAGDFSPLRAQHNIPQMYSWIKKEFIPWIKSLDTESFIFCAGNHDFVCEDADWKQKFYDIVHDAKTDTTVAYLENEEAMVDGYRFFGCPYSDIPGWAFSTARPDNAYAYKAIPYHTDVLIVHQAPKYLNVGTSNIGSWSERDFGSKDLFEEIQAKQPMHVVCGHIHSGNHTVLSDGITTYHNVSYLDESYKPTYEPYVFEI